MTCMTKTRKVKTIDKFIIVTREMYRKIDFRANNYVDMEQLAKKLNITIHCYRGGDSKLLSTILNNGCFLSVDILLREDKHCVSLLDRTKYVEMIERTNDVYDEDKRKKIILEHFSIFSYWGKNIDPKTFKFSVDHSVTEFMKNEYLTSRKYMYI